MIEASPMRLFLLFTGFLSSVQRIIGQDEEVCFPQTGCLSMTAPWVTRLRPFPPPHSPEQINLEIYLETRNTVNELLANLKVDTSNSGRARRSLNFRDYRSSRRTTVFIIHGFSSQVNATWIRDMADAYLTKIDANVFLVDWEGGANQANYLQVASNTRIVGILLANFIQFLIDTTNLRRNQIHIIGHSLGSHIAGYVGKRIPNINRITALDAAQPGFEGHAPDVRLDISDALNIDVHHTNAKPTFPLLGLGFITPLGHVDFYYNGGVNQPGCITEISLDAYNITSTFDVMTFPVELIQNLLSCSHSKAVAYFIEALQRRDCVMWGTRENAFTGTLNVVTFGRIQSLWSSTCSLRTCVPVGLDTFAYPGRGKFHVATSASAPYCSLKFMKMPRLELVLLPPHHPLRTNVRPTICNIIKEPLKVVGKVLKIALQKVVTSILPDFSSRNVFELPDDGLIARMSRELSSYYQTLRNPSARYY